MICDLEPFFITMRELGIPVNIKRYMEIGVQDGNSTLYVAEHYPNIEQMVLCDTWGDAHGGTNRGSHDYVQKRLVDAGIWMGRISFLDGDANILLPEYYQQYQRERFDLIVIDDDHSVISLSNHLDLLIGKADFIACHDICMEGLKDVVYLKYITMAKDYVLIFDNNTMSRWAYFVRRDYAKSNI
jgi:predicted O-methyltransferase YrrM